MIILTPTEPNSQTGSLGTQIECQENQINRLDILIDSLDNLSRHCTHGSKVQVNCLDI